MNKLTTKNWMRVRINNTTKTICFTNDTTYKTESECLVDIKSNQYIAINKRRFDKMIAEGWKVVDGITKVTNNITKVESTEEPWQPLDLTGEESTEESVRKYYVMKKQRQAVHFVKGVHSINEKSYVSAREVFGESKFPKQPEIKMDSAFMRFHKSEIGRERQLENDRMEARQ